MNVAIPASAVDDTWAPVVKDSTYEWLPDRHLGVAATLSHADELIGQVADLLLAYQMQPGGVFGLTEVPAAQFSRTVVDRVAPIPRKVALLVADALVTLRSAIEHTLFAEVEFLEGSSLDEQAARLVEMPALETYEKFQQWKRGRAKKGPLSLRAGSLPLVGCGHRAGGQSEVDRQLGQLLAFGR